MPNSKSGATMSSECPECYPKEGVTLWRDLPVNEAIRDYVQSYISPPAMYYFTLDEAMAVMGITIEPEDLLNA